MLFKHDYSCESMLFPITVASEVTEGSVVEIIMLDEHQQLQHQAFDTSVKSKRTKGHDGSSFDKFAWKVGKTRSSTSSSNRIPRLCTVTINQLILKKAFLESCSGDSLVIAVKMNTSKRTLRSNEISIHGDGGKDASTPPATTSNSAQSCSCPDTGEGPDFNHSNVSTNEVVVGMTSPSKAVCSANSMSQQSNADQHVINLDLTFALQYPHDVRKNENELQILLQRMKRFKRLKNRAIFGYKTLAGGIINMSDVIMDKSHRVRKELELREHVKESSLSHSSRNLKSEVLAKIIMSSLKNQALDSVEASSSTRSRIIINTVNPKGGIDIDLDEDTLDKTGVGSPSDSDGSEPEEGGAAAEEEPGRPNRKSSNKPKWMDVRRRIRRNKKSREERNASVSTEADSTEAQAHNKNLKQKFVALLKKFKLSDSEASDSEIQAALEMASASGNIEDIFEFEDSDVDSLQEFDGISISSTPRPGLKPFFSSKSTLVEENEGENNGKRLHSGHSFEDSAVTTSTKHSSDKSEKPSLKPFFSSSRHHQKALHE